MFGFLEKTSEPTLSRIDTAHGEVCAAIHASSFAYPWSQNDFEALLLVGSSVAHGAFEGKSAELLGFILARRAGDEAEILTVAVAPRHRGKGLAARLLRANTDALAAHGVKSLFLEVEAENRAGRALYERAGFQMVGERKSYYRKADGTTALAYIMRQSLG